MRQSKTTPGRILIVDDEERLLESLVRSAQANGYEATGARDGIQALEQILRQVPDVVVTDLRMPGLDGAALMGRLLEEGITARVVVITGYATLEAAVDCLRHGAVDFLVKPFEVEEFLASVARALSRARSPSPWGTDWGAVKTRFGLTRRETQILQGVHDTGKSNRKIAEELCIAPETVKSHLKAAFRKLGVSNRAQIMRVVRSSTKLGL